MCAVLSTIASDTEVLMAQSLSSTNRAGISKERTLESTETRHHHWSLGLPSPISLFVGEQDALTVGRVRGSSSESTAEERSEATAPAASGAGLGGSAGGTACAPVSHGSPAALF